MSPEMHERIVWKSLRAERPGTTRQIYQAGNSGDVVVETDGAEYKDGVLYRVTTAPPPPASSSRDSGYVLASTKHEPLTPPPPIHTAEPPNPAQFDLIQRARKISFRRTPHPGLCRCYTILSVAKR